jgi:hypothetical protein
MIENQLEVWLKRSVSRHKKSSKKRKRQGNDQPLIFSDYNDIRLISEVVRQSGMSASTGTNNLALMFPSITKGIQHLQGAASSIKSNHPSRLTIECNIVSIAFLERLVVSLNEGNGAERIQLPSGDIFDVVTSVIDSLGKIEAYQNEQADRHVRHIVMLYSATTGLAATSCKYFSNANDIGKLFPCSHTLLTRVEPYIKLAKSSKLSSTLLLFEAYVLLGCLGKVVPYDCSPLHLKVGPIV